MNSCEWMNYITFLLAICTVLPIETVARLPNGDCSKTAIAADNATRDMTIHTYMSVPHDDDVSGVTDGRLPLSVHTGAWDPTLGEHVKLGHAHWTIAVDIRRNSTTEDWGGEGEGGEREGRRKE